jgi:hypothetical protein
MIAQMSGETTWSQIVARAWADETLMERLLTVPEETLSEFDLDAPPGMSVEVVLGTNVMIEDLEGIRRYVLPANPPDDLIEEDLAGGAVAWCYSAVCGACAACGCRCACRCRCF